MVAETAWQLNPLVDLHWRVMETACVAFESVSGETTVVDAFDAAALAKIPAAMQASLQNHLSELSRVKFVANRRLPSTS